MTKYLSDLEIANAANKKPISDIANSININEEDLIKYGNDKAKLSYDFINSLSKKDNGKLILVTAISPTPAGEGKTTTSVGLVDGLCHQRLIVGGCAVQAGMARGGESGVGGEATESGCWNESHGVSMTMVTMVKISLELLGFAWIDLGFSLDLLGSSLD